MSWGIKITVLYLGFVGVILTLVIICFGNKTELEYKDYYAREIRFQDQINAAANSKNLGSPITYKLIDKSVQLMIPKEILSNDLKGSVYFLRPSDASKDKNVPLLTNAEGVQVIDPGLVKGVYKMQISFTSLGKSYYKEEVINFN